MEVGGQRHAPAALPRERSGTHCIGSWVGPRAGLDGCGKSSIPGPSSSQRVAISTRNSSLHQSVQTGYGAHLALYFMGTGVPSRGVNLTTHFHLVQRLRMSGAIPTLHPHPFTAWTATLPLWLLGHPREPRRDFTSCGM
jgi:hypothetical protein